MKTEETGYLKSKEELSEFFNSNGLTYLPITYCGCNGFFIPVSDNEYRYNYLGISVTMCNKEICRIYPHEILYIAIEDRKSALYLTNRKVETYYSMNVWKSVLDKKSFAQPHYSYLINLNYVEAVTKDFVTLRYGKNEYKVYTSQRKIVAFKKAVLAFGGKCLYDEK